MKKKDILKQLNILFQDDEKEILDVFCPTLELVVGNLYSSTCAKEGLEILQSKQIDIIVTDIQMPNMDAIDFCKIVTQSNKMIPIIFLSAYSNKEYLFSAIDMGIVKYLVKPIEFEELITVLEDVGMKYYNETYVLTLENGFKIDLKNAYVITDTQKFSLTPKELDFLKVLYQYKSSVNEELIISELWESDPYEKKDALYTLIMKVRKKIGKSSIINHSKIGYSLAIKRDG